MKFTPRRNNAYAFYLEVSMDYLIGKTDDPTPPKKELTDKELLSAEIFKMSHEKNSNWFSMRNF